MKNLLKRAVSGILYILIIVAAVCLRGWWFVGVFSILGMLAIYEVHAMLIEKKNSFNAITTGLDIVAGGSLITAIAALNVENLGVEHHSLVSYTAMSLFIGLLCIRLVAAVYSQTENPVKDLATGFFSIAYVALPLGVMSYLYRLPNGTAVMMLMFVMIWLNDTGAFAVGSMMGRRKLFPSISPAKTWEGFVGGLCFAAASGVIAKLVLSAQFEAQSYVTLAVMGIAIGAFATWGDLLESRIKRSVGVKDSGKIMPGHGGILDRIDSLLLVAPVAVLLLLNL